MPLAVAVAASGGRDSTALLHCTARQVQALGGSVHALHVHHGLVADADAWLDRLRTQCRRWDVEFHVTRLSSRPAAGESIEAWARRERYRALAAMARAAGCSLVLLAHHRRDQAETLLLQALRGGGPAGLAAMPRLATRNDITWARPWLGQPRASIDAYLARHRLRWSEDGSNADPRFARNRLRQLWPSLLGAFPDAEPQLEAAAGRAAEAAACLAEQVRDDLGPLRRDSGLDVAGWKRLGAARRGQALRAWLRGVVPHTVTVPETLVRRLQAELPGATAARWPAPEGELRVHRGVLTYAPAVPHEVADAGAPLRWDRPSAGRHAIPGWSGALVLAPVEQGGVAIERLARATVRPRQGGEQFQLSPRSTPRSLKKQFQARGVPAWCREGPLLFDGNVLLFAPGLGVDARCQAPLGEAQFALHWEPAVPR